MIRYLPLVWCPLSRVWLALDLVAWRLADLDAAGRPVRDGGGHA